jgi:hypothetical protein
MADQGAHFYFDEEAIVHHEPDRTFESWLRVAYEYGRYAVFIAAHCGHTEELNVAVAEWPNRHPLNRLLPRLCVGHPHRMESVIAAAGRVIKQSRPGVPSRMQLALCSALVSIQYWQGVADASRLGAKVWLSFNDIASAVRP